MRKSGINMEQVKKENRSLIIKCINNNGPLSRKDIASLTGLTAASVTQITTQLIDEKVLKELGSVSESTGVAGRKKVLLDINPKSSYVCSINIESETTTIAICDIMGNLVTPSKSTSPCITHLKTVAHSKSGKNTHFKAASFLAEVAKNCEALISMLPASSKKLVKCVSVGIPGIVDKENGIAVKAYGIWDEEVPVRDILEKELTIKVPVIIENNVDAFAKAEILFGAGKAFDSLLVIKWGPGVGSTIVVDSEIYQGRHGKTAELGHFIFDKKGKLCSCGRRGCLETHISYSALTEILGVSRFEPGNLGKHYKAASFDAKKKIDNAIDLFARSIVNTCTIIAPNRVVLSGSLFKDPFMRNKLITACSSYDSAYNARRLIYTSLSEKESYIGPAAVFISSSLY